MFGSGKTTVLEHLDSVCASTRFRLHRLSSPALIPRMLESQMRIVLLDEVDRSLRPDRPNVQELDRRFSTRDTVRRHSAGPGSCAGRRLGTPAICPPSRRSRWQAIRRTCLEDTVSRSIRILLMPDLDGTIDDSDWEEIFG